MVKFSKMAMFRILAFPLFISVFGCSAPNDASLANGKADIIRDCPNCPELVVIQPGSFQMGSTKAEATTVALAPERAEAEQPAHEVKISDAFAIGRHELTIKEFAEYADATGFKGKGCWTLKAGQWSMQPEADWRNPGFIVTPDSPAVCLSWDDYQGYMTWLSERTGENYRLPSEAEWEYVAQKAELGPRNRTAKDVAACKSMNAADESLKKALDVQWPYFQCDDGHVLTAPVGSYGPDKLGLFDIFGNVSEFTSDCYFPNHEGAPSDGSPRTDKNCGAVTIKGGSWAGEPNFFRPAFRVTGTKDVRGTGFGIRVLREVQQNE